MKYEYEYLNGKLHNLLNTTDKNTIYFNTSSTIYNNAIIYVTRVSKTKKVPITPGNLNMCNNVDTTQKSDNFLWGWSLNRTQYFEQSYVFYCKTINNQNLKLLNFPESPTLNISLDVRVTTINDKLYIYDSTQKAPVYQCEIILETNEIIILKKIVSGINGVSSNITLYDVIENESDVTLCLYDWFYENGIKQYVITVSEGSDEFMEDDMFGGYLEYSKNNQNNNYLITYNKKSNMLGIGSNILPGFSFGSPNIKVNGIYYGVGHTKINIGSHQKNYSGNILNVIKNIKNYYKNNYGNEYKEHYGTPFIDKKSENNIKLISDFKYGNIKIEELSNNFNEIEFSKVQRILDNLKNTQHGFMTDLKYLYYHYFGIDCSGYIYMMYFYKYDSSKNKFYVSDSFLPLNDYTSYKFSLIFPMGIYKIENDLYVTAGEGDFYSLEMKFDFKEVDQLCFHDTENINENKYNYYLLSNNFKNNMCEINNINNNKNGGYYEKYLKYKNKYFQIKYK